jgi:hypothetical protein
MSKDKDVVVSFRVDKHLADMLARMPDKSAFIRDVIMRSFYRTCPVCMGRGVLPEEVAAWAAEHLKRDKAVSCECCRYEYPRASLPEGDGRKNGRTGYTCPHCREHDHTH